MSLIQKLTPTNLEEEKQKFFDKNFNYNPRFRYANEVNPSWLTRYGLPEPDLLNLAAKIVQTAKQTRPPSEGEFIRTGEVYKLVDRFLKMHRLDKRYQVIMDPTIHTVASATSNLIKLYPEAKFTRNTILSTIYHEIGTHVLRRVNYEKQPWYKKKKRFGLTTNYLKTEEGLAVIHGRLPKNNKLADNIALKYLAVAQAQKLSFKDLFAWLEPYVVNPTKRWRLTVRLKRGLADTGQPGGFTKDLLYFAGLVKVWRWLKKHDFQIDDLYYGKVAIEDLAIAKELNPNYRPILPSFYLADKDKYRQQVLEIGRANFLT